MANSGQIIIVVAGTAVAGPDVEGGEFFLTAHPDNTDTVWVGNDGSGDVDANNGYPLKPGGSVVVKVTNLKELRFDAGVGGEKICWLRYW